MLARFAIPASIASRGQTERGSGELVSGNYFDVLGLRPTLGRLFALDDDRVPGAQPVVVLNHAYWTRRFGGDPGVLNQTLLVNNTPLTIVGVAAAGFTGIQVGQAADIFVPLMMKAQMTPERNGLEEWDNYWLAILARRKPGLSMAQTEAGINAVYRPLLQEQLAQINGWGQQKRQRFLDKKSLLVSGAKGPTKLHNGSRNALNALFVMVELVW